MTQGQFVLHIYGELESLTMLGSMSDNADEVTVLP